MLRQNRTLTQAMLNFVQPQLAKSCSYHLGYCPFHSGSSGFDLLLDKQLRHYRCTVCGTWGRVEQEPPPTVPPAHIELIVRLYDYALDEPKQGHRPGPVREWFERRRERSERWIHRAFLTDDWSEERAARVSQHVDTQTGKPFEMVWFVRGSGGLSAYRRQPGYDALTRGAYGIYWVRFDAVPEALAMARSLRLHKGQRVVAPPGTTP